MRLVLLTAAVATFAAAAQPPAFEVASIKPNQSPDPRGAGIRFLPAGGLAITNLPLYMIVAIAYNVPYQGETDRLTGGPSWTRTDKFDIQAKAKPEELAGLPSAARIARTRAMLQTLLAEQFQLKVRREAKETRVYAITATSAAKLKPAPFTDQTCPDDGTCHVLTGGRGRGVHGKAVSIADLAAYIENWTDCPVVDHTRLTGLFIIDTEPWANLATPGDPAGDPDRTGIPAVLAPLGLNLKPAKDRVEGFVIEHAARPSAN